MKILILVLLVTLYFCKFGCIQAISKIPVLSLDNSNNDNNNITEDSKVKYYKKNNYYVVFLYYIEINSKIFAFLSMTKYIKISSNANIKKRY